MVNGEMSDYSDVDDPPLTKEEVEATLSEQVNVTTSIVLPDLRAPVVPHSPPKKIRSRNIFLHECTNIPAMRNIGCFNQLLQHLDEFFLTRVFEFEHPWNREIIIQSMLQFTSLVMNLIAPSGFLSG